jgi:hypothetical protein
MDFSFSDDQLSLRELARKIFTELSTHERLKAVEASPDGIDRELWSQLARSSLLGVAIPDEYGGSGMGYLELCLLLQEGGRAVAQAPLFATLVLGALPIAEAGSAEQKQRWLPGVAAGDTILSGALHEAGAVSLARPETAATREGGGYRVDGRKSLVPAAAAAARILVPARSADGLAWLLIDPQASGLALARQRATNREPLYELVLQGVRVPAEDVLCDGARGLQLAAWLEERATAAVCAIQLGVSERALEMTAAYGRSREQFERPIGSFQAFHQRAADAYIQVEAIRLTAWQAISKLARGEPAAPEVAVAKLWASEGGRAVGYAAQHLHGGIGVDVDYPLHRYYQWSKQLELTLGNASQQLERIGAALAEG